METPTQQSSTFEENNNPPTLYDRITNSIILKMIVIFFLTLFMLIPMNLISDLIRERKNREQTVSHDISSKWGSAQVTSSPILAIPYVFIEESIKKDAKGTETVVHTQQEDWIFILPEKTNVQVHVNPEYLKRGIYQSVVYNAKLETNGSFGKIDFENLGIKPDAINWKQTKLIMGVRDVKGLSIPPKLTIANQEYGMNMNDKLFSLFPNNLVADLKVNNEQDLLSDFHITYELKGSKSFNYLPLASQSKLDVKGNWGNPSFNGGFLPDERDVQDSSFSATWNIPSFARKLPQQWLGQTKVYSFSDISLSEEIVDYLPELHLSAQSSSNLVSTDIDMIQINFLPEVNNYQKTTRVAKYGILVIILTFASLFFTEIIKKKRVHIFQYILIGAAMVLFYSLLLAISEHLGFNIAYIIAALATIILISSFIKMITKNYSIAYLFAGILGLFYLFIYVLMQLRDYSLMVGTIGLFVILAVLMRISTKVNWYQFDRTKS